MTTETPLVIIDYEDLLGDPLSSNQNISSQLSKAFSSSQSSLGIIAIRNIPSFVESKQSFLPLAHKLSHLPTAYLEDQLTDEKSMYNAGWSHGKEQLKKGQPDFHKASFYFNPITDVPGSIEDREKFPASYPVNKWPSKGTVDGLEDLGKELGKLMREVVALLAGHVDIYVREHCGCQDYSIDMAKEMERTEKVKGRLLYYFPLEEGPTASTIDSTTDETLDSWIGWHNDSGFFTALAGDLYVDHDSGQAISRKEVDPKAGLMVMDRNGNIIKVDVPEDCMAVQIGECLQIITGGNVVATPHCVRGVDPKWIDTKGRKIARISFPCFVDTIPNFPLKIPQGSSSKEMLDSSVKGCAEVPPLDERLVLLSNLLPCICVQSCLRILSFAIFPHDGMFNFIQKDGTEMGWSLGRFYKRLLQSIMSGP